MIKVALNRKHVKEEERKLDEIDIDIDDDIDKSMIQNDIYKETNNNNDYVAKYYENKEHVKFSLTNKTKFMSNFLWKRVHQLLTNSLNKNDSKCRIFQIQDENSVFKNSDLNNKYFEIDNTTDQVNTYVKESRFSYIRPIHDSTRLIFFNSSNITSMECMIHLGGKVTVEVPEGCMIVFTNDAFHAGVKSYATYGGNHLSHLRLFSHC